MWSRRETTCDQAQDAIQHGPGNCVRCGLMRTILFDWDGTIVDSMPAILQTEAAISRHFGLSFDESIFRRAFSPNWRLMYRSLGVPEDRIREANQIWAATFHADQMWPFLGIEAALARLAAAGYTLGLVTSADRAETEPQLPRLGLDELLRVRVYADDTAAGKPDPEPLRLALELAGVARPEDALYIGDALDDMRMAAAAGVRGIGIVSMVATADDLLGAGAFESAGSVVEWADRFLGESTSAE
jgi:HAD superfamily hydrolase (TIGR01509 family)